MLRSVLFKRGLELCASPRRFVGFGLLTTNHRINIKRLHRPLDNSFEELMLIQQT